MNIVNNILFRRLAHLFSMRKKMEKEVLFLKDKKINNEIDFQLRIVRIENEQKYFRILK